MIFVRRQLPALFDPFFVHPDPEAYIFPHLSQEKVSPTNETGALTQAGPNEANNVIHRGRNVNVTEQDDSWTIFMDMPGVKTDNIEIEEDQGNLKVLAKRKTDDKVTATYQQVFALDPVTADASNISTELADGVLTITIPKKPKPAPVTVEVIAGDAPEEAEDPSTEFRYSVELPGVKASGVKIEFRDGTMYLEAERKKGRFASSVQRMFTVGHSVDMQNAKAYLIDGILTLVAPRLDESKPETRKITLGKQQKNQKKEEEETTEVNTV